METRDRFAISALEALLVNGCPNNKIGREDLAKDAYRIADAMMQARKTGMPKPQWVDSEGNPLEPQAIGSHKKPTMLDKHEAGKVILGAILIDNAAYDEVAKHLKPSDFRGRHITIFQRMSDLIDLHCEIDYKTLTEILNDKGELEQVGGVPYLAELTAGLPRRVKLAPYIEKLRNPVN